MPGAGHAGRESSAELEVDVEPAPLRGDVARLRQLVTILVDNAIRHGPAAGGDVTVRCARDADDLVVEDDGPGLAPGDLHRVFERFWRRPDAPDGGTGLGLSIAGWIAERHGGTIAAAVRAPHGAAFTVKLPTEGPAD